MNNPLVRKQGLPIEGALESIFAGPVPDPAFITTLEQQLLAQNVISTDRPPIVSHSEPGRTSWLAGVLAHHRWGVAAASLLLAMIVALTIVTPQAVWAGLQRLTGYVPGIGFVDFEKTRVLTGPIEVTRDGVTLRVEQVVAEPNRTMVVIRSTGLPAESASWSSDASEIDDYQPRLQLPDGSQLVSDNWALRLGGGTLEFPALPEEVYRVHLELPGLPLSPAGAAPEDWAVPLTLRPATGELVAGLFSQPYAPMDASDTHVGISVRVLEVAHEPEETALRLQIEWPDPDWRFPRISGRRLPELRDNLGHVYVKGISSSSSSSVVRVAAQEEETQSASVTQTEAMRVQPESDTIPMPASSMPAEEHTLAFAPISQIAQSLTLWIDAIEFDVPAEGAFSLDLGDHPEIGDYWPLDVDLLIAGFPVHITGARLAEEFLSLANGTIRRTELQFDVAPVPDQRDRALRSLMLDGREAGFSGSGSGYDRDEGLRASLSLSEEQTLPTGLVHVTARSAAVLMTGPWEVTWDIPGATSPEDAHAVPVVLPAQKVQTHNGLSLRIEEVVQTDRLTAVTVGLVDPPAGVALDRLLSGNPMTQQSELYMEDDRGRRYEPDWRIGWLPRRVESLGSTSATISERMESTTIFEPLQPLARRATMQAPAVQITRRGSGHFDVSVPDGVPLSIQSEFGPASEPWDVDIWVDVAGYTIHFTQARLETMNGTVLVLTSDNVDAQADGRYLSCLRFASITAPDGRSVSLDSAFGDAGAFYQGDSHLIAVLYFGAVNPTTHTVQPGQYHVELAGVAEIVEGPWLFNWRVGPVE